MQSKANNSGRRSYGDGSLTQTGPNKFWLRYDGPPKADGSRRQVSETVRGNKAKARQVLRERLQARDNGAFVAPANVRVYEYMEQWITRHSHNIAPKTVEGYRSTIRNYILPTFGQVKLQNLQPATISDLYTTMAEKGLSTSTIGHTHKTLTKALKDAVSLRVIPVNPASLVTPPRQQRKQPEMWTPEEFRQFLRFAESNQFRDFFEFAALTGMRRSEIAGLKWVNIDLEKAELRVVTNLQRIVGKGLVEGAPKSHRSRRNISLSRRGVELLRSTRTFQLKQQMATGSAWTETGYVFTDALGMPFDSGRATKEFKDLAREAGLKPLNLHTLRHLHASVLISQGVHVKVVSERLGHASVAFTLDTYGHLMPGIDSDAANRVEVALGLQ